MIRILQLPNTISRENGRMSVIMSIYRHIDRTKIQFDFAVSESSGDTYLDEIEKLGGKVFVIPSGEVSYKSVVKMVNMLLKKREYSFIHYHAISIWGVALNVAHRHGVKIITHSHATYFSDGFMKSIRNRIFSLNIKLYSDKLVAVSPEAGRTLFGKQQYIYIPNVINYKKYTFSRNNREKVRRQYNIDDGDFVVGHVGRLSKQKNQQFLIRAFSLLHASAEKYKLMLVGSGPLEDDLRTLVSQLNIERSVIFVGAKQDVTAFYSAFDLFWLPSLYEGLPTVGLEAQANGLSIIASDRISPELAIENVIFSPIRHKSDLQKWCHITLERDWPRSTDVMRKIEHSRYNYQHVLDQWKSLYDMK